MPSNDKDTDDGGWEELPSGLRMAAMVGHVNPRYTKERKRADEALSSALSEKVSERKATPRYSWDRNDHSLSPRKKKNVSDVELVEEKRRTLREEAEAMRRRLEQLGGKETKKTSTANGNVIITAPPFTSSPDPTPVLAVKSSTPSQQQQNTHHSYDILRKKLQKVEKLLEQESPGTKEHKKLLKKRVEYQTQLREIEVERETGCQQDDDNNDDDNEAEAEAAAAAAEEARKEELRQQARRKREAAEERKKIQRQLEEEEEELERQRREQQRRRRRQEEEEERAAAAEEQERQRKEAICEEARRLKQQAIEKKQREAELAHGEERQRKEARLQEARQLKEQAAAAAAEKKRKQQQEKGTSKSSSAVTELSTFELDEQTRKKAFLEEARRLKQEAEEKKRQQEEAASGTASADSKQYMSEEQKRKEAFLEEARRLKADAIAKKEIEEAAKRAQAEAKEERRRLEREEEQEEDRLRRVQIQAAERERKELLEAQRLEQEEEEGEEREREALMEKRRLEREAVERQHALTQHVQEHRAPRADSDNKSYGSNVKQPQHEASKDFLDRRELSEPFSDNTKKILRELENMESRQKRLEKSLTQNGIPIIEEIPYEVAKDKIAEISDSMKELASSDIDPFQMEKKYFLLEEQLSKYTTALMLTDEYAEEQKRLELEWEDTIESDNVMAIRKLRSHMPVTIRSMTEDELADTLTPNGKTLPKALARKFKRTNILQLIRVNPDDIEKMHPSLLEGIRTTGLTLTERRAIHEHLRDVAVRWQERQSDPSAEKKFQWFHGLKAKFKESLDAYTRHVEQYGPVGNHKCTMIGLQCPLKADAATDYSGEYGFTPEAEYETSDSQRSGGSVTSSTRRSVAPAVTKSRAKSKVSDDELLEELRVRLRLEPYETDVDKKLLRELSHADKRTKSLEKQLMQVGLALPQEEIPYSVAKTKVMELTEEIKLVATSMGNTNDTKEIARLEAEFGKLSQEMDKYNNALMLTKEWAREQEDKEKQWEARVSPGNYKALQMVWRHMPVNIRDMSETHLTSQPTPTGQMIPKAMAKKFKRTNILMLLRMDPASIEPMHPSSLEAMRTTGLTLTERRALHEHLKHVAPKWKASMSDKMAERRWMWHEALKSKLKEDIEKYDRHLEQYGPPGNHSCTMLGMQCPLKADLATDYTGDLGFPDHAVYGEQSVAKSNLLSMEDIERRKREDEMEYGGGGYSSIPSRNHSSDDSCAATFAPPPRTASSGGGAPGGGMGGLLAAIQKKPSSDEDDEIPPRPARPAGGPFGGGGMGGLLAEISKKKQPQETTTTITTNARPAGPPGGGMGGLLAEISNKKKRPPKEEEITMSPHPSPTSARNESPSGDVSTPGKKKGILAKLTRRKK